MSKFELKIVKGMKAGAVYPVSPDGMKLGRSSQCEIDIPDPLLSRSHCCFDIRNGELWVTDLASANQTFVNGKPVEESRLTLGDMVTAGDNTLEVCVPDEAPGTEAVVAPEAAAENGEVVIDLGFGKTDEGEDPETAKKSMLRPIIWALGAILVLVCGVMLIGDLGNKRKPRVAPVGALPEDHALLLDYERVEADAQSIFRYELRLTPDGKLSVKIDDVGGAETNEDGKNVNKDRHVSKEKQLDKAVFLEITREIETSGFFSLDESYSGFAAKENELQEQTMIIALGKKARTCKVTNRTEPDAFKKLREKLETFSKNELGIWAIQFSTEKLTALAKEGLDVAKKKFAERDVRYGNLFESQNAYREAIFYLDTVNPKPDFYNELLDGYETAENELERRYKDQRFRADRAINLSDWSTAQNELRILCEMIPDRSDKRNREASQKLIDVETRLKKR